MRIWQLTPQALRERFFTLSVCQYTQHQLVNKQAGPNTSLKVTKSF